MGSFCFGFVKGILIFLFFSSLKSRQMIGSKVQIEFYLRLKDIIIEVKRYFENLEFFLTVNQM